MYNVYQHWDPLKVCVVGRSYPPEFYSWIDKPAVRNLFERIAIETEEDYQNIIKKLESFGVKILRPELPTDSYNGEKFLPPPMTPRDHMVMIGNTFYDNYDHYDFGHFYWNFKHKDWPWCNSANELKNLPDSIRQICINAHDEYTRSHILGSSYDNIITHICNNGNKVKT